VKSWKRPEAQAEFEELVGPTTTEGPRRILEDDKIVAVVLSVRDYEQLKGEQTPVTASGP
jgi:hypothetical protein